MAVLTLQTPVSELFMVGEPYAKKLKKLEIETVADLLYHFPARYEDFSQLTLISQLKAGQVSTIRGQVLVFQNLFTRFGKNIQKGVFADQSGQINFIFFNQPYLKNIFRPGAKLALAGKVEPDNTGLIFKNPEHEILKTNSLMSVHSGRLVPIYPETAGVSSKWLRSRIFPLLFKKVVEIEDWLPSPILEKEDFPSLEEAIKQIHFPESEKKATEAKDRLSFDELFLLQLRAFIKRKEWQKSAKAIPMKQFPDKIQAFIKKLPFQLTNDQNRAVVEIIQDLTRNFAANRLLQGDVGSGKTVVAAIAAYLTYLNGHNTYLMAPTELLAQQHYQTFKQMFAQENICLSLITSSHKEKQKEAKIVIGTHALLFRKNKTSPKLLIIDEQHRFGVAQRSQLLSFKPRPHLLSMTATPIPRTMSLAFYGDMDLSLIKQMPLGRKKIKTWLVPIEKRQAAYKWLEKRIKEDKSQAYIVCPLIEESQFEKMKDIKAVTIEYERLQKNVFPGLKLALLHGRLKSPEKDRIINDFKKKKYDILVSTPVIEVGIDIANAAIMLIEGSERFGLAQLHQLRGRVGRSKKQSYCLLFTSAGVKQDSRRLKAMETKNSGFELAELDLKIRGPGEIYGLRQSGRIELKIADLSDSRQLLLAKNYAGNFSKNLQKFPLLHERLKNLKITDVKPN